MKLSNKENPPFEFNKGEINIDDVDYPVMNSFFEIELESIKEMKNEEFILKKEIKMSWDVYNDEYHEINEFLAHFMTPPSEQTYTISFNGVEYENCSLMISKDGKRMEFDNGEVNGVVELK